MKLLLHDVLSIVSRSLLLMGFLKLLCSGISFLLLLLLFILLSFATANALSEVAVLGA
jgi:hypothetical protein